MRFLPRKFSCLILPALLLHCGPFPDLRALASGDITPPVLLGAESSTATTATLTFSEPVTPVDGSMALTPTIHPSTVTCTGNTIILIFDVELDPGTPYCIESTVADKTGNRTRFIIEFYGFNPRLPDVVINEFITQGSGSHPDLVELYILEDGNLSGMCVLEGSSSYWSDRCILPPVEAKAGDYLLIHFKPDGDPSEVDETTRRDSSSGKDASDDAWDFWIR
jgi:hypothetical protein